MRRDLMNWDAALQLAQPLASDEIPLISTTTTTTVAVAVTTTVLLLLLSFLSDAP